MNSSNWKPRFRYLVILGFVGFCVSGQLLSAQAVDAAVGTGGPPSRAEQESMLTAMRQYAAEYISHLPNFICTQDTQQFESGRKATHWHKGDTLRFRLVFDGGSEQRSLELVNSQPPRPGRRGRMPLTTEGEFGTLLGSIFGASSETAFSWNRWDMVRGHRVAVIDFAVDREHSTLKLSLSDLANSLVPYHGSVYAEAETGEVWKISSNATDIPVEIRTRSIATTIEYSEVPIGGVRYLLPVEASVLLDTGTNNIRNEMWFSSYRKFEADSSITYTFGTQAVDPTKPNPPQ